MWETVLGEHRVEAWSAGRPRASQGNGQRGGMCSSREHHPNLTALQKPLREALAAPATEGRQEGRSGTCEQAPLPPTQKSFLCRLWANNADNLFLKTQRCCALVTRSNPRQLCFVEGQRGLGIVALGCVSLLRLFALRGLWGRWGGCRARQVGARLGGDAGGTPVRRP